MHAATVSRIVASLASPDASTARAYGCGVYAVEAHARARVAADRSVVLVMGAPGQWLAVPRPVAAALVRGGYERAAL